MDDSNAEMIAKEIKKKMGQDDFVGCSTTYDGRTIGERIRERRKELRMTQKQLADKLGVKYQTVQAWELNSRNPKLETVEKLASALGVSSGWLVYGDEDSSQRVLFDALGNLSQEMKQSLESGTVSSSLANGGLAKRLNEIQDLIEYDLQIAGYYKLLRLYDRLNKEGRHVALERLEELTQLPKFRRQPVQGDITTEQSTTDGSADDSNNNADGK